MGAAMTGDPVAAHDLSIVIPFRADGPERVANLQAVIAHLLRAAVDLEIIVVEDPGEAAPIALPSHAGLRHHVLTPTAAFHRTAMLNFGMEQLSTRAFAASWDSDAMIYPDALNRALAALRDGTGLVYPYDGRFIDIRGQARQRVLSGVPLPDVNSLPRRRRPIWRAWDEIVCLNEASVGGAVMVSRAQFSRCGGYHEGFRAWGYEDAELRRRMDVLGAGVLHISGAPLLHLSHPRRRGAAWYKGTHANRSLHGEMEALDRAGLEAKIAAGALRADRREG
jgi:hypothetical protein